jgi:ATP-dependent protease ClpP protease subunit
MQTVNYTAKPREAAEIFTKDSPPTCEITARNDVVVFHGDITAGTMKSLANVFDAVSGEYKVITLMITSKGGNAYAIGLVREIIKHLGIVVNTVAVHVASAGVLLWMLGKKRSIVKGTTLLIHGQMCYRDDGTVNNDDISKMSNKHSNKYMASIFAKRTKMAKKLWRSILNADEDAIFSADEALKAGLATRVVRL